jgi:hypothetical protein
MLHLKSVELAYEDSDLENDFAVRDIRHSWVLL